jgi:hypothetical protein
MPTMHPADADRLLVEVIDRDFADHGAWAWCRVDTLVFQSPRFLGAGKVLQVRIRSEFGNGSVPMHLTP